METKQKEKQCHGLSLCFTLRCVSNVCFVILEAKDNLDIELHTQKDQTS